MNFNTNNLKSELRKQNFGADRKVEKLISEHFDLRPYGLIEMLDLIQPIYQETAAYGHFGREQFPWESLDKVEVLKSAAF